MDTFYLFIFHALLQRLDSFSGICYINKMQQHTSRFLLQAVLRAWCVRCELYSFLSDVPCRQQEVVSHYFTLRFCSSSSRAGFSFHDFSLFVSIPLISTLISIIFFLLHILDLIFCPFPSSQGRH